MAIHGYCQQLARSGAVMDLSAGSIRRQGPMYVTDRLALRLFVDERTDRSLRFTAVDLYGEEIVVRLNQRKKRKGVKYKVLKIGNTKAFVRLRGRYIKWLVENTILLQAGTEQNVFANGQKLYLRGR